MFIWSLRWVEIFSHVYLIHCDTWSVCVHDHFNLICDMKLTIILIWYVIILIDMIILIYKKSRSLRVQIFVDTWPSMCNLKICRIIRLFLEPAFIFKNRSVPVGIISEVSLENRYQKQKCCCLEYRLGVFCLFLEPPFIFKNRRVPVGIISEVSVENRHQKQKCSSAYYPSLLRTRFHFQKKEVFQRVSSRKFRWKIGTKNRNVVV